MISFGLARLTSRKLLRISGPDCYPYLQGLLCNDLRYLYEPDRIPPRKNAKGSPSVISTFMLNAQGRVICDLILYRTPRTRFECEFSPPGKATEYDELLIECESSIASGLANTFYGYRVRRKIKLSIEENLSVWCLYPKIADLDLKESNNNTALLDPNTLNTDEILSEGLTLVQDPRLTSMGFRIISNETETSRLKKSLESVINENIEEVSLKKYTLHRYALGLGEGIKDHPESNCFPLECNGDYLNSVSFNKGCYLGQELTARIHYTGVVRKRLMPLIIDRKIDDQKANEIPLLPGGEILDGERKKKIGTLRNVVKNRGLALLRHEQALSSENLVYENSGIRVSTYKPNWWNMTSH